MPINSQTTFENMKITSFQKQNHISMFDKFNCDKLIYWAIPLDKDYTFIGA